MNHTPAHPKANEYFNDISFKNGKSQFYVAMYPRLHPNIKITVQLCRTGKSAINAAIKWQRKANRLAQSKII